MIRKKSTQNIANFGDALEIISGILPQATKSPYTASHAAGFLYDLASDNEKMSILYFHKPDSNL